jgi:thiosulfate dehydrogenase [quinone] large subunit
MRTVRDPIPTAAAGAVMAAARILCGLLWLSNVGWKRSPFRPVRRFLERGIEEETLPAWTPVLRFARDNIEWLGWGVLLTEAFLGAFLLLGFLTRFWALVGAAQSLFIGLTVANVAEEWGWSYWLMIAVHLTLFATAAGRTAGLDGVVRPVAVERGGWFGRVMLWAG